MYDHFPSSAVCARLLAESRPCLTSAVATAVATSDKEELRGGNPARRFISAGGGEEQAAFYHSPETSRFLTRICSCGVRPTGEYTAHYTLLLPVPAITSLFIVTSRLAT